jgi:polysaccharide biosynthesis protein PslH
MKKRMLFLSNRGVLPIKDGHTRRSFNILRILSQEYRIHYLSLYERPEELEPKNVKELERLCERVEFMPGPNKKIGLQMIWRVLRSLISIQPYTIWRHYSADFQRRAADLIHSGSFDLIHCDTLPIAYCLQRGADVPQTITDHDVSYLKCRRMAEESKNLLVKIFLHLESKKMHRLEERALQLADLGIVVSELDGRLLGNICGEARIAVIENGVDVELFRPEGDDVEADALVWVGGFDHPPNREGMRFFIDKIYPILKRRMPAVKLDVIGGSVPSWLKRYSEKDGSIKIRGYVEDPMTYIRKAGVFIVPILSGGGTRLKVLEAMAAGKAIVTTSLGCEGIDGANDIHYLVADTPESFAQAIQKVSCDAKMRGELGKNAREFVEVKYEWRVIRNKLLNEYSGLSSPSETRTC